MATKNEHPTLDNGSPLPRRDHPRSSSFPSTHPWKGAARGDEALGSSAVSRRDDSCEDLRDRLLSLIAAFRSSNQYDGQKDWWLRVWRALIEHPWFQEALRRCAAAVLRRAGLPRSWREDLEQDAILLLARDLQRRPDLGVDLKRAESRFSPWMREIITNRCRDAARRMHRTAMRQTSDTAIESTDYPVPSIDLRIDMWMLISQLPSAERAAVTLYGQALTVREIAAQLGLSYDKTVYVLRRGLRRLRISVRAGSLTDSYNL